MWITQILQVAYEISPEMMSTIELVTIPAVRKRMGMVSMAPPTIELNIASTVVAEGLTLSTCPSIFKLYYNHHHDSTKPTFTLLYKKSMIQSYEYRSATLQPWVVDGFKFLGGVCLLDCFDSFEIFLFSMQFNPGLHQVSVDVLVEEVVAEHWPQFGIAKYVLKILHVHELFGVHPLYEGMGVIIRGIEAEIGQDEGLEGLQEILARGVVFLLGGFPDPLEGIRTLPIIILRFLAPAGLRLGINPGNAGFLWHKLKENFFLLHGLFLINVSIELSLSLFIHVGEVLVDLDFTQELTLLLKQLGHVLDLLHSWLSALIILLNQLKSRWIYYVLSHIMGNNFQQHYF